MGTDLFVVGGAVGALWGGPAGWASMAFSPITNETVCLNGFGRGRLDDMDIKPFAAAIQWWHNKYNIQGMIHRPTVLCVTDAPGIVAAGKSPELRDSENTDWKFIDWFERRGYQIHWHWESRDDHPEVIVVAEEQRKHARAEARAASGHIA